MRLNSITFKLLALVLGAFIITIISVIVIADTQLEKIVDRSQNLLYTDKVDMIWEILDRSNTRLHKTGLPGAYAKDFKETAVKTIREAYYRLSDPQLYPFILDNDRKVVMHPVLPDGDFSLQNHVSASRLYESDKGEFIGIYRGREKWYVYRHYKQWNWVIGFAVPTDLKYADSRDLRNTLVIILVGISVVVLVVLTIVISKFTKPITHLTQVSSDIADGKLEQQIMLDRSDEIGTLARSFSRMRDSIKSQIIELEEERNRAENIIEGTNAGTWVWDIVTGELEINELWAGIIGYTLDELQPIDFQTWVDYVHPSDLIEAKKQIDLLHDREIDFYDVDFRMSHKNGEWVWVNSRGKVIEWDENMEPAKISGTHLDITERKQLEEMMVRSEKMASVAGLAAGMAHEINNPLAAITQGVQNVVRRIDPAKASNQKAADEYNLDIEQVYRFLEDRKVMLFLNSCQESCVRAAAIVKNMLLFSRKSDSTLEQVNLVELVERVIQLGTTDYDMNMRYDFKFIEVIRDYDEELPEVPCCTSEIEQVLLNLLKNASQAMEMIEDETFKAQFIIRLKRERRFVRIEVEDNGPGISDDIKSKIFEPFFTTKPTGIGTGLGLSVCYMIITQNHSGTFEVESEIGKGTKFVIRLPLL